MHCKYDAFGMFLMAIINTCHIELENFKIIRGQNEIQKVTFIFSFIVQR